jgi:hypothetical protein
VVAGSSFVAVHPRQRDDRPCSAEDLADPRGAHPVLDDAFLKSALLLEQVSVRHGLGAISTAHSEADVDRTVAAYAAVLERCREAGVLGQE